MQRRQLQRQPVITKSTPDVSFYLEPPRKAAVVAAAQAVSLAAARSCFKILTARANFEFANVETKEGSSRAGKKKVSRRRRTGTAEITQQSFSHRLVIPRKRFRTREAPHFLLSSGIRSKVRRVGTEFTSLRAAYGKAMTDGISF